MALQREEIFRFEAPAFAMCTILNVDPYAPFDILSANSPPQWFVYAQRMAEHEIMVRCMRESGWPV